MSVLDECDIEYSVETDLSNSVFYERDKNRPNVSWGLIVSRKLVASLKTLRALWKYGVISRKEKIWLTISSPMLCHTVAAVSFVCAFMALLLMIATMTIWPGQLSLAFMGIGLFTVPVGSVGRKILKKVKDRLDEQFNIEGAGRIELDWSEQDLYEIAKSLSNSHDGDDVKLKKMLFELVVPYPADANERINELYKTKEAVPAEAEGSEVVLSDVDKLLEKLFRMRDSSENLQIISQAKKLLREAIRREKTEQMGVSVEKLSEISEFVNKSAKDDSTSKLGKNEPEVSEMVNELNNVEVEYETAGKDNPGLKAKHLA